jgi:dihydrodipicolinate synthase/N-acetylneuraminate lyase
MRELRAAIPATGFIAALKLVLGRAGLPVRPDVRAPLRPLSGADADRVAALS